ncbi:hypothetical protein K3162_07915 [Qipengyuania xiapuensis]|uniref:Uncharacterized protein n=1 Tax=Qipengyuania xiapuensis TaxID=2867236 RepID=A0ABX8ZUK6_9SPHN|nr:hypothetical protein [Qipengyuania xiapuensis]QZD91499.1 hypothetical protein K3162_07915 [Qipengyuania xiapuensis]
MGEAVGLPEWLAGTLFAVGFIVILGAFAWRNTSRKIARTKAKRPSPTREEFIAMMAPDVSGKTACFLWDTAIEYLEPRLAPHPDDDLAKDLPIADEDWSMYWPSEYAELNGFHESNLADWPEEWPPTLRNFGKWLDRSPKA